MTGMTMGTETKMSTTLREAAEGMKVTELQTNNGIWQVRLPTANCKSWTTKAVSAIAVKVTR